ncbi:thioesterase family protein [soil metagenome]
MRAIPLGYESRVSVTVTDEMTVNFEELGPVHSVYATYWMAKHMEEAGRKIILPFLAEDEEGIGSRVSVRHLASALPGMQVDVVAEHVKTEEGRIHVQCRAYNELGDLIGEGETEQMVLPRAVVERKLAELASRARKRN